MPVLDDIYNGRLKFQERMAKQTEARRQATATTPAAAPVIPQREHQTNGGTAMPVRDANGQPTTQPVVQQTQQAGQATQPTQPVITQQQVNDAVTGYLQGMQQRKEANMTPEQKTAQAAQESAQRHQNNPLDPMNQILTPRQQNVPSNSTDQVQISDSQRVEAMNQQQKHPVTNLEELMAASERAKKEYEESLETPEQKAAREKKEKRDRLLATIGDGLGAFHEAFSYMRGQKPMTSGSISAEAEARRKALGLERDKITEEKLNNWVKIERMIKDAKAADDLAGYRKKQIESLDRDREEKRKMQQEKNNAYIKLQEARRQNELEKSDYYTAYLSALNSGADKETAEAFANQEVVRLANEREAQDQAVAKAKENSYNAQANQRNAAANASNARAAKTADGGGSTTTHQVKVEYKNGKEVKRTDTTTSKSKGGGGSRSSRRTGGSGQSRTGKGTYSGVSIHKKK